MQRQVYCLENKDFNIWFHIWDRLIYIPGALVMLYGFWLSLTV